MFCEILLVHVRARTVLSAQIDMGSHLEWDDMQRGEKRNALDLCHMGLDKLVIAVVENDCRQARDGFVKVQRRDDRAFICESKNGMSCKQLNLLGDLERIGAMAS